MQQVDPKETVIILKYASEALQYDGDFVEFGCYKGDTSVKLAEIIKGTDKHLWLYDSFAGLPAKTREDQSTIGSQFQAGELLATKRQVADRFRHANLPRPIIKKAFFNELNPITDLPECIAFAFLDGDLYDSLKTSLHFVWPKLSPGATIITHDYNNLELPGATQAVDEFLHTHSARHFTTQHTLALITK